MSTSLPFDAVTFDFWNTICVAPTVDAARARRLTQLHDVLTRAGATVAEGDLEAAIATVGRTFDEHWRANRQYTHREAIDLLLHTIDVELEEVALEQFTGSFTGSSSDHVPDLAPDIEPTLRRLATAGIRLGIICDVGLSPSTVLRRHLDRHGVLDLFDHHSFSDEVGWYKPAPEIFRHALVGLGASATRAVHIGDLRRTDVAGALGAGLSAVRYRGLHDDDDRDGSGVEAPHVIDEHLDLLAIVGLGH